MKRLLQRIQHYADVYAGFIGTSFTQSLNFRVHFVLLVLMDLCFYLSTFASVYIIYEHVEQIGTWKREQLLFFCAVMLSINQLTMTFISESYWRFPYLIRSGEFDFYLLKPINTIFGTFLRYVRPGSFVNIIFTSLALIYFGVQNELPWLMWVLLPFLILAGFALQNAIELVIVCSMFWMLEGTGINFLRMEMQQLSRWPDFIYNSLVRRVLTVVVPILLIGSAPVRFIFNLHDFLPLLGMLCAFFGALGILNLAWRAGLRAYESASS